MSQKKREHAVEFEFEIDELIVFSHEFTQSQNPHMTETSKGECQSSLSLSLSESWGAREDK